jgi:hypothetical protein
MILNYCSQGSSGISSFSGMLESRVSKHHGKRVSVNLYRDVWVLPPVDPGAKPLLESKPSPLKLATFSHQYTLF